MSVTFIQKVVLVFVVTWLLSACSVFPPVKTEQTTAYVLNTLPRPVVKKSTRKITLMVMQPATSSVYNTTEMAYTIRPYQIAYFAKSRWAETPAQMVQLLLAQALEETHHFDIIGLSPALGHYDYVLDMQLLQFQQRFFAQTSDVIIRLQVQLIKTATNQVIITKQLVAIEPAPENTPYGGVVAANKAVAKLLAQVVKLCLQSQ